MKSIALLSLVCGMVTLFACQEPHDAQPAAKETAAAPSGSLEGTWKLRSLMIGESSPVDTSTMIQVLVGFLFSSNDGICTIKGNSMFLDSTRSIKFTAKDGMLTFFSDTTNRNNQVVKYGIFGDSLALTAVNDEHTVLSFKRR